MNSQKYHGSGGRMELQSIIQGSIKGREWGQGKETHWTESNVIFLVHIGIPHNHVLPQE